MNDCVFTEKDNLSRSADEPLLILILIVDDGEQFGAVLRIRGDVLDDVDVVEEDEGVQDGEGRVVEDARQHDILEVEQAVGVLDFVADLRILELDNLFEFGGLAEELPVGGAMGRKVRII